MAETADVFPPLPPRVLVELEPASEEDFVVRGRGAGAEGCALADIAACLRRAAVRAALRPEDLVLLSGSRVRASGCGPDPASALRCYAVSALEEGALPFGQGARSANPALRVVVLADSVQGMALGWLLEAARRDADLTFLLFNTAPDPAPLAAVLSAGGTFAARLQLSSGRDHGESLARALRHKGFSFVDCIGLCPEHGPGGRESCERFSKAAYALDESGHDPSDPEAARRKAGEPFDTPPLGLFFETRSRVSGGGGAASTPEGSRAARPTEGRWPGGASPVTLPAGPTPEEREVLWEAFR